jgi:DNA (cytosine-5)-methyltransferase 1
VVSPERTDNTVTGPLWLLTNGPNPHVRRIAQLVPEAERRGKAEMVDEPREWVKSHAAEELISEADLAKGEAALVVGGPPCQPFSKAAYWLQHRRMGLNDSRAGLLSHYLRILRAVRPEGVIFENVASLLHPANRSALDATVEAAHRAGYSVDVRLIHTEEYGIPQTRSRVAVMGLQPPRCFVWP